MNWCVAGCFSCKVSAKVKSFLEINNFLGCVFIAMFGFSFDEGAATSRVVEFCSIGACLLCRCCPVLCVMCVRTEWRCGVL